MQFESLFVDFDPRKFTKEHPFWPEGCFNNYYLLEKPEALHYHDFFEIGYCLKGSGLFYVDGQVIPFNGPCCTIIYGGQIPMPRECSHLMPIRIGTCDSSVT